MAIKVQRFLYSGNPVSKIWRAAVADKEEDERMDLSSCTALVTGANRGLGSQFATQLLKRGAKVYAGARNPDSVTIDGAIPLAVDITDPESITAAVAAAGDVTLLVNNAG